MKKCTKCHSYKNREEFNRDCRTKDNLQYWCRSCQILRRNLLKKNGLCGSHANIVCVPGKRHCLECQKYSLEKYRKVKRFLAWIKTTVGCTDCHRHYVNEPYLLDFDHIKHNTIKEFTIGSRTTISLETLQKEITKCEVVCVICHRRRSHTKRESRDDI